MTDHQLLELLVEKVTGMDKRMSGMEQGMSGMEQGMSGMNEKISGMDERMSGVETSLQEVKAGQLRMEKKFDEQIGALKDGFELRGDQIERLQEHLDNRLDEIQTDLSYVVTKVAQHDRNFVQIRNSKQLAK